MRLLVKICGLSTQETVAAAVEAGADFIGFVFHPRSPRYVAPERAEALAGFARGRARSVALLVDPDEPAAADIAARTGVDWLQLHGMEPAGMVEAIRAGAGRPVIKALGVAGRGDLDQVARYAVVSDLLLIDAKPPRDAAYPGGHGKPFDWSILGALDPAVPFMLSGGLTPDTVAEAIGTVRELGVTLAGVDVSSGVETAPGVKDVDKIRAFVAAVRQTE